MKKKLKMNALKLSSFCTNLDENTVKTVQGGNWTPHPTVLVDPESKICCDM